MAKFITPLVNEDITYKYSRIYEPFVVESGILCCTITVPVGFVHDYESVPMIKGTSKRGGVIHDYLCRIDSDPVVSKKTAADVYFEVMECRDGRSDKETDLKRFGLWWRRWLKYTVVRIAWGYFHKHRVMATYEQMAHM